MIFLDTGFFVALAVKDDAFNKRAKEIKEDLADAAYSLATSDHVVGELITLLSKKEGNYRLALLARDLAQVFNLEFLFSEKEDISAAIERMQKFGFKSYCDGLTATLMQKSGISKIVSFDSDFDRVPGIKRIY